MPVRRRTLQMRRDLASHARNEASYQVPNHITTTTLVALLASVRDVPNEQQPRLSFATERLWCAGDVSLVKRPAVAIIGTRGVSLQGASRARRLARELA